MRSIVNEVSKLKGVCGVLITSKDGLFLEDSLNENDISREFLGNLISIVFGSSEKTGEVFNQTVDSIGINGNSLKIKLFDAGKYILVVLTNKDRDIENEVLKKYANKLREEYVDLLKMPYEKDTIKVNS